MTDRHRVGFRPRAAPRPMPCIGSPVRRAIRNGVIASLITRVTASEEFGLMTRIRSDIGYTSSLARLRGLAQPERSCPVFWRTPQRAISGDAGCGEGNRRGGRPPRQQQR